MHAGGIRLCFGYPIEFEGERERRSKGVTLVVDSQ